MRIAVIVFLLTLVTGNCSSPHLSDAALEKNFQSHESDFERLLTMSKADSRLMRIAPDFTWLVDDPNWPRPKEKLGFSEERWSEYRQLFSKLGLANGLLIYRDEETTYFLATSTGLVTGGSSKGYVFSERPLTPLVDSLESVSPDILAKSPNRMAYKRIKTNWYLFYDSH